MFASVGARGKESRKIEAGEAAVTDVILEANDLAALRVVLAEAMAEQKLDWCVQPLHGRKKRLLVADMTPRSSTSNAWTNWRTLRG